MCGRGAWRVATVGGKGNLGLPVEHLGWYYSTKSWLSVPTCFNEACENILVILGLSGGETNGSLSLRRLPMAIEPKKKTSSLNLLPTQSPGATLVWPKTA